MVADSKDEEPVFIGDSLVQLRDQWWDLAGALFPYSHTCLWCWRWQQAAWALASGEQEQGAGTPPPLDRSGLGGYQQPQAHRRAGDWRHQGHSATGESSSSPRHGFTVLGLLIWGQRPNPLWEKNRQVTGWAPTGPLPERRSWLGTPRWYHYDMYDYLIWAVWGTHLCAGPCTSCSASLAQDQGQGGAPCWNLPPKHLPFLQH